MVGVVRIIVVRLLVVVIVVGVLRLRGREAVTICIIQMAHNINAIAAKTTRVLNMPIAQRTMTRISMHSQTHLGIRNHSYYPEPYP